MTDHELLIELNKLMSSLRNSAVERYNYFYAKGDSTCPRVKQSMEMFIAKDKERILSAIRDLYLKTNRLE